MHVAASLHSQVAAAFFSRFPDLTDTQRDSIPPILRGDDTLIISGTGSGKTEAVLAPLISRYFQYARLSDRIQIIYIAPTKALVNDVAKRIAPVLEQLDLAVSIRHGDNNQLRRRSKHTLLITTPESLEVLLATKPEVFIETKALVIDEAHLLFNQQRGFQLAVEIHRLESYLSRKLQVVAASATIASPVSLWSFFRPGAEFTLTRQNAHREIRSHIRIGYEHSDLVQLVAELPSLMPLKILIFGDTKRDCDAIALKLEEDDSVLYEVFSHHASLSPDLRLEVERKFNENSNAICVATSTLELGIDIGDINLVIIWGKARNWQSFMQRIGRGNRRSDFVEVICVIPKSEMENISSRLGYQSLLGQVQTGNFPQQKSFELYGVVCQQICVILSAKESGFISVSNLFEVFAPFEFIEVETLKDLLLHMAEIGILIKDPNRMAFGPSERIHELRDKNLLWSNIPHSSSTVPVTLGTQSLGNVSSSNLFNMNAGSVFAFATKRLRVTSITGGEIRVTETSESINSRVKFGGSQQAIEISLISALRDYLGNESFQNQSYVFPRKDSIHYANELSRTIAGCDFDRNIPYYKKDGKFHYITFGGLLLNSTLAHFTGDFESESNSLVLVSKKEIDFSSLSPLPQTYSSIAAKLDLHVGGKTEYQDFLTEHLKSLENISKWISESYHASTLTRLVNSIPFEIAPSNVINWA